MLCGVDGSHDCRGHAECRRRAQRLHRTHDQQEKQAARKEAENGRNDENQLAVLIQSPVTDAVA
jgi:ferredoxin